MTVNEAIYILLVCMLGNKLSITTSVLFRK